MKRLEDFIRNHSVRKRGQNFFISFQGFIIVAGAQLFEFRLNSPDILHKPVMAVFSNFE